MLPIIYRPWRTSKPQSFRKQAVRLGDGGRDQSLNFGAHGSLAQGANRLEPGVILHGNVHGHAEEAGGGQVAPSVLVCFHAVYYSTGSPGAARLPRTESTAPALGFRSTWASTHGNLGAPNPPPIDCGTHI